MAALAGMAAALRRAGQHWAENDFSDFLLMPGLIY